jgi:hypothetical protein
MIFHLADMKYKPVLNRRYMWRNGAHCPNIFHFLTSTLNMNTLQRYFLRKVRGKRGL